MDIVKFFWKREKQTINQMHIHSCTAIGKIKKIKGSSILFAHNCTRHMTFLNEEQNQDHTDF
jgi:hypothetical protein